MGKASPPDCRVGTNYVRQLFGGRSDMWVWRAVKSGLLPPPHKFNGQNTWLRSEVHVIAKVPLATQSHD